jgi:uncharacterized membrane protein
MTSAAYSGVALSGASFTLGGALARAFEVLRRGFGRFALLALIAMSPTLASTYFVSTLPYNNRANAGAYFFTISVMSKIVSGPFTMTVTLAASTAIFYGAYQQVRGQPFGIGQSLLVGLKRIVGVFCVTMIADLPFGFGFVSFIGLAYLGSLRIGSPIPLVVSILFFVGFFLLLAPGVMAFCLTYVAVPICVVERPGIVAAIRRSMSLTKGYRWQIFGLFAVSFIASVFVSFGGRALLSGGFSRTTLQFTLPIMVFDYVWTSLYTAFASILATVVYHQLRIVKEGMDVETIAGVFD